MAPSIPPLVLLGPGDMPVALGGGGGGAGRGEGAERGTGEPQNFVSLSDRRLAWKGQSRNGTLATVTNPPPEPWGWLCLLWDHGVLLVPTLPLGDLVVAMRGERRALPRGEFLVVVFRPAARRSRLFPSFFGVLRMLNAIDWRLSACRGGHGTVSSGQDRGGPWSPPLFPLWSSLLQVLLPGVSPSPACWGLAARSSG